MENSYSILPTTRWQKLLSSSKQWKGQASLGLSKGLAPETKSNIREGSHLTDSLRLIKVVIRQGFQARWFLLQRRMPLSAKGQAESLYAKPRSSKQKTAKSQMYCRMVDNQTQETHSLSKSRTQSHSE